MNVKTIKTSVIEDVRKDMTLRKKIETVLNCSERTLTRYMEQPQHDSQLLNINCLYVIAERLMLNVADLLTETEI